MQFIPIVEYKGFEKTAPHKWNNDALPKDGDPEARPGHPNSIVTDWSVDPDDWGYFLCKVFDEWRSKDVGKVLVNHFETLVSQHMGLGSQICIYGEFCGKGVAVEHDGGVYSCDHYVYPEYRLGNIKDQRARHPGVFPDAGEIRLRQERDPAEVLPAVSVSHRLLGRMSEEPDHPHAGRRAGPELSLPRLQAILRARHSRGGAHLSRTCESNRFNPGSACEPPPPKPICPCH